MERNRSLDILKALCSFMVVCIHATFAGTWGSVISTLSRVAVPLFFMITGYYYTHTKEQKREKKQLIKIFYLVCSSNVLFLVWTLFCCWIKNESIVSALSWICSLKAIAYSVIFNISFFQGHLWYLNAVLYVLLIVFLFEKKWNRQKLYPLIPVLILTNLVLGAYSSVILGAPLKKLFTRNFLFIGLQYFLIGDMIYTRKIKMKTNIALILAMVFALVSLLENFLLNTFVSKGLKEFYFGTAFSSIFCFIFALQCNVKTSNPCNRLLCHIGAKLSTSIYILHPIVIAVLGQVVDFLGSFVRIVYGVYYIQPIVIYTLTVIFAWGLQWSLKSLKAKFCVTQSKNT